MAFHLKYIDCAKIIRDMSGCIIGIGEEDKDYANGRAVHAINNIGRVYDERLEKHDFL